MMQGLIIVLFGIGGIGGIVAHSVYAARKYGAPRGGRAGGGGGADAGCIAAYGGDGTSGGDGGSCGGDGGGCS